MGQLAHVGTEQPQEVRGFQPECLACLLEEMHL